MPRSRLRLAMLRATVVAGTSTSMPSSPLRLARLRTSSVPVAPLSTRIPSPRLPVTTLRETTLSSGTVGASSTDTKMAGPRPRKDVTHDRLFHSVASCRSARLGVAITADVLRIIE